MKFLSAKRSYVLLIAAAMIVSGGSCKPPVGHLEVVAVLEENPGNLTVSTDGRVFASVHQFRPGSARLVEVLPGGTMIPWPNDQWNTPTNEGSDFFVSVLGVQIDELNRLWVLDNGLGAGEPVAPRLFAFDVAGGELLERIEFSASVGPAGSFFNDLAVDPHAGFAYIADIGGSGRPGLVVVDLDEKDAWRYDGHPSFEAEADGTVTIGERTLTMGGRPAKVGINPITISADYETVFYGAMSGTRWYSLPAAALQGRGPKAQVLGQIETVGPKPVSDGAATDQTGNHYFTNVGNKSIDRLDLDGNLTTLAQHDELLSWPDALSFGSPPGWLFVAVNKLHLTPALNDGEEGGDGRYYIVRIFTGEEGVPGR